MSIEVLVIGSRNYESATPLVDREQLDSLLVLSDVEDAAQLAAEFFSLFQSESERRFADLDGACDSNDITLFRKIIHFVAGSAGNIGLNGLMELYRMVEKDIDSQNISDVSEAAQAVRALYEKSCEAFKSEFGEPEFIWPLLYI